MYAPIYMLDFVTGPGWHVDTNFKALMGFFLRRGVMAVCCRCLSEHSPLLRVRVCVCVFLSALMNRRRKLDGPCY